MEWCGVHASLCLPLIVQLLPSLHRLQVISRKLGVDVAVFADLGPGVYFIHHRTKAQAKWVGFSPDLCRSLCGLFFQLYQKEHSKLSPLEVELKFFSPLAADWNIKVWVTDPKELALERAKKIVEFKTLKPLGLNNSLKFTTKEVWEEFTGWFAAQRRQQSWLHKGFAHVQHAWTSAMMGDITVDVTWYIPTTLKNQDTL